VQALLSSHVIAVWTQPTCGSQESAVHALPSSQSGAAPPTQAFWSLQVSPVVQAFPSSHGPKFEVFEHAQLLNSSPLSSVQGLLSSQTLWPTQFPAPSQASGSVQVKKSLQGEPAGAGANTQPMSGSQES
jgi:hypothetical protein